MLRLTISILLVVGLGRCSSPGADLFAGDAHIRSLSDSNLFQNIYKQDHSTLVFFYLHWCGHCVEMSAALKEFAKQIHPWRDAVQVVALDCATFDDVCNDLRINRFPHMLLVPPDSQSTEEAKYIANSNRTPAHFYQVVLDFLIENQFTASHHYITPIYVTKNEEICNTLMSVQQMTYVVVEKSPSTASAEVFECQIAPYIPLTQLNSHSSLANLEFAEIPQDGDGQAILRQFRVDGLV